MLVKLGKLAFKTLLSENGQILREDVLNHLKPEEIDFSLNSGILSKDRGKKRASCREHAYSFLHATYQEFLACLYLVSLSLAKNNSELESELSALGNIYRNDVLSVMFIFLCGLDDHLSKEVEDLMVTSNTRSLQMCSRIKYLDIKHAKDNVLRGKEEADRNKMHPQFFPREIVTKSFQDIRKQTIKLRKERLYAFAFICEEKPSNDDLEKMISLLDNSRTSLLYIFINAEKCTLPLVDAKSVATCNCLHTLELRDVHLTGCLNLVDCTQLSSLTLAKIEVGEIILNVENLHYCFIKSGYQEHNTHVTLSFKAGSTFSSKLNEVTFYGVNVKGSLDFKRCKSLDSICLYDTQSENIEFENNAVKLGVLGGAIGDQCHGWEHILESMKKSWQLKEMYLGEMKTNTLSDLLKVISTASYLEKLQIIDADMGNIEMDIPMTLQKLFLENVRMHVSTFNKMMQTMMQFQRSVNVKLVRCEIIPDKTYTIKDVVEKMKQSSSFEVSIDDIRSSHWQCGLMIPRVRLNSNVTSLRFHTVPGIKHLTSEETPGNEERAEGRTK